MSLKLNKSDTNYDMNRSGKVVLNFTNFTLISTFRFKHNKYKKWEKNMYFICIEAKGAHLVYIKEMESNWFNWVFENLQKTEKKQKKPLMLISIWSSFLCQNSLSLQLGTMFYCPLPHFTSVLVKMLYCLCKHLVYV